jgi:hypothetical protein
MRRLRTSRRTGADLLARPPVFERPHIPSWLVGMIDPVAQLKELADLVQRGIISQDEFEHQKAKVLSR